MPSIASARVVVVTGVNGFVGHHLARELASHGYRVVGIGSDDQPDTDAEVADYVSADLTREWPIHTEVDGVVHLAGLSAVGPSFGDPGGYVNSNGSMLIRMGEAFVTGAELGRVVVVSTGAVYQALDSVAIDEESPTAVTSPYVVSKLLVETLALYYRSRGLDVVVARPFNHTGPGQGPGFILPDLAQGLHALRPGEALRVGDLDTQRDYTDVRDVARAYRCLLEAQSLTHTTYNVCSGRPRSGREILGMLTDEMGIGEVATTTDPARLRPTDPQIIRGDGSVLASDTGWRPEIPMVDTVRDFVEWAKVGRTRQ